ncbi:MAG: hypothetical protein KJO56_00390 [Gammaproteobacteria bacterium]|nr:hypothetical protein [Gammaproteobacteria bacterium]MBT8105751.1 hypothetical protein [Gammaproteobacteria bacterium]NNF49014.1 hypothetical protein [Woeseiaceae bacterium]NNK25765.1 hypothetical protein [Woeseiaceae bacterium]NNL62505.1 hypothetical protein [Woeseiaceae bacterium]
MLFLFLTFSVVAAAPPDGAEWFGRAQAARQDENYGAALKALENAEQEAFSPVRIAFERARIETLSDDRDAAVAELQALADNGFSGLGFITGDPILSTLEGHPAFDVLVAQMAARAYPCEHDEAFRAFDFWVGDWDVHVAGGGFAGTNTIERAQRGCVLIENWSSAGGGAGMSVNYLDKATGEWVQVWNAEGGSQIHIRGGMTEEGMLLVGTLHDVASGTTTPFRGLWTQLEDGRVRQFFEQSTDGGTTWATWFEGFYSRKQ